MHLEFANFQPADPDLFDIAILVGDIRAGTAAVRWALRPSSFVGKPVLLVPGNHEFYVSQRTRRFTELRAATAAAGTWLQSRLQIKTSLRTVVVTTTPVPA